MRSPQQKRGRCHRREKRIGQSSFHGCTFRLHLIDREMLCSLALPLKLPFRQRRRSDEDQLRLARDDKPLTRPIRIGRRFRAGRGVRLVSRSTLP